MPEAWRAAVLISGRGSNLQALIESCARPGASALIALVLSDRADAPGLERARAAGIPVQVLERRRFEQREGLDHALCEILKGAGIEIVCLAGFMRILGPAFVERWRDRVLNVHPSLLPAFRGLDVHRRVLEAGVRFAGCTVHFLRAEVDAGPIIVQGVVPVHQDDTEATLAARVLAAEHRCYPLALELVASGRARVEDERVVLEGAKTPGGILLNPVLSKGDVQRPGR
jgi:phosphoribosylglycinamide formyltransferase-1